MSHFYTASQLSRKNRNQLWRICDQIGCAKRRSIADCITEILALQPQPKAVEKEFATIDSIDSLTQPYIITVSGVLIHRTATYAQAERFCQYQGYQIADAHGQAQSELAEYIEEQAEEYQIDDYLFHNDMVQPKSTEAGTIPQQHNGYFDLSGDITTLMSAVDQIVSHNKIVVNIPKDVEFKSEWKQKLLYAAELIESMMLDVYSEGLEQSDKLFLAKCM